VFLELFGPARWHFDCDFVSREVAMSKESPLAKAGKETGITARDPSADFFATPFPLMRRFAEEVERMFEDFGRTPGWWKPARAVWAPNVEVLHRNGEFLVRAALPGLTKDDVKVEVTNEGIVIEGERKQEKEETKDGFYRSEFTYGRFHRLIPLPEGAASEQAKATFTNGVLEVRVPAPAKKAPAGRTLTIEEPAKAAKTGA
jgi:HSP20 family protein